MNAVKLRLSNVIEWTGFAAAMFPVLCIVLWGELVLQPHQSKQAEEVEQLRASVDAAESIIANITNNGAPPEVTERAKAIRAELEDSLAAANGGFVAQFGATSNRDFVNGTLITIIFVAVFSAGWLLFGVLNYIFFGPFRPLPWKPVVADD